MKKVNIIFLIVLLLVSCNNLPDNVSNTDVYPAIYPDYIGVTIPEDIAPLNFNFISNSDVESMDVVVNGSKTGYIHLNGKYAKFDIDEWHQLVSKNKGGKITFTVCAKINGKWNKYKDFNVFVSKYALDEWGLTYRRIAPGYEVYGKMGIYQRDLSNYDEFPIIENTIVPGACLNCHTSNATNPKQFTFHVRGANGATLVQVDGKRTWLNTKIDTMRQLGSCVYPYWHPSGKYCAYSTNKTRQSFHAVKNERIEVLDQASDVMVYKVASNEVLISQLLTTKNHYETYPAFSPDGHTLYFCSSEAKAIPFKYKEIKYNICKIAFNSETGEFGNKVDTIFNARKMGRSATFPRPSYDGKYIMFTMSDYGCFPIWHKEADLWLLNLKTGKANPMVSANSGNTESFHNWNINSHWFVFSSRRGDGLYTRLYLASVDDKGNVTKPFLLPQKNPWEYYDESMYSYNIPDFTKTKVDLDVRQAGREILSNNRTKIKVKDLR
jgi:hypothetical protein